MNEELQSALAKIIETTIQAKDFCLEQAPDLINQLLAWKFAISLIWFVVGLVIFSFTPILFKMAKDGWSDIDAEWAEFKCICGSTGTFFIPVAGLCLVLNNLAWLQIWIAPKVYLLEYASALIN
jgi:hypothetical protein